MGRILLVWFMLVGVVLVFIGIGTLSEDAAAGAVQMTFGVIIVLLTFGVGVALSGGGRR